jgi:hypothetical protein
MTAGKAASNGILSDSSFDDLKDQVVERVLQDPGLGHLGDRGSLRNLLPRKASEFRPSGYKYKAIKSRILTLTASYLPNWEAELSRADYLSWPKSKKGAPLSSPNVVASRVVSFLLEEGVHIGHLTRWLDYRTTHTTDEIELTDLVGQLADFHRKGTDKADVLVLLEQTVNPILWNSLDLLDVPKVKEWLANNGFELSQQQALKVHGGLTIKVEVWDLQDALTRVENILSRINRRAELNGWKPPIFSSSVWIKDIPSPKKISTSRKTGALLGGQWIDSKAVLLPHSEDRLEVALEFVEAAATAGGASAAGMLWAALESLFAAPGDPIRLEVVSRAADVGLLAYVKFDLKNTIATFMKHEKSSPIAQKMKTEESAERIASFENYLRAGDFSQITHRKIATQVAHTAALLEPDGLRTRRSELQRSLRALYRHRNLVLHGGVNDAPLLESVLRGGYPLVAAIVERYGRDSQKSQEDPQTFAASAYMKIERYMWEPKQIKDIF